MLHSPTLVPSLDRVLLVGEVEATPEVMRAKTPELRITYPPSIERDRTTDGEKRAVTDFHRVVVAGKIAARLRDDIAVGDVLYVDGQLMNRGFKHESEHRFITEIHADRTEVLDSSGRLPSMKSA